MISLIAAISRNYAIGAKNGLPWGHLPADMKHFVDLTKGKPVVMGRKTYESIPEDKRPLKDRLNIVLTKDFSFRAPGCTVVHSVNEVLGIANLHPETMIIGGASLYALFLSDAKRMYLTRVEKEFEGDVYFPYLDWHEWREREREERGADEKNPYGLTFLTYEKI